MKTKIVKTLTKLIPEQKIRDLRFRVGTSTSASFVMPLLYECMQYYQELTSTTDKEQCLKS